MNEANKHRESTSPNTKYFLIEFDINDHDINKDTQYVAPIISPT